MRGRFRMNPGGSSPQQPWFHIGTLEVTTTWLVVLVSATMLILNAFTGNALANLLLLSPSDLFAGKVWSVVTWPFAFPVQGLLWSVITIALFWYFGSDLENSRLGRNKFLNLLIFWVLILAAVHVGLGVALGVSLPLYGLSMIQLMVILLWIAEWPDRRFIFNIPAWLFGVIIVGIQILQYLGTRNWLLLLTFLVGTALCAIVARSYGMLGAYPWIPKFGGGGSGSGNTGQSRPRKQRKAKGGGPTVVAGPWDGSAGAPSSDDRRMDELLEKIHEHGADALTSKERKELMKLRERRRRG